MIYRRQLRELATRLRAKQAEEDKAGIPELEARMDAEGDLPQSDDLGERFPHSLHALAARLIIELEEETFGDRSLSSPEFNPSRWTLQALRPFLTGAIARDASELLARADDRLSATFNDWFGVRWHDAEEGDGDDAQA